MIEREEVLERVRAGNRALQISSDARNRHISEMEELLASFERANEQPVEVADVGPSRLLAGVRNSVILVAAFVLGMAAAASSELVPGDLLYPAKRAAEQPVQIVDHDIVASNRVGELEELILRGADPEVVLMARTDAIGAVQDVQPSENLTRALNLLAWPGGLIGHGVTAGPSSAGLVISNAEWDSLSGYTASLADGHLVTVSSLDDELLIGTTGNWTVVSVGGGWRLTSADVEQSYFIERRGDDLVVSLEPAVTEPSSPAASVEAEATSRSTARSNDWTPPLVADDGASGRARPDQPLDVNGDPVDEAAAGLAPTVTRAEDSGVDPESSSATSSSVTSTAQTTEATRSTQTTVQTETTVVVPGTPQPTTPPPSTTLPPSAPTSSPQVTVPQTTEQPTTVQTVPPTQPSTTTTTVSTTTAPPVTEWFVYLRNGGNSTSSSRSLTMSTGSAPGGSLGNYDTDRDDAPGLMLAKDGAGLSTSDRTKYQEWVWTVDAASALNGDADLRIWLAAKDFKTDERIGLLVSLDVCDPGCSRAGTGQWSGPGSGGFTRATIRLGSLDVDLEAGATVRLKVVVPDSLATTDVWLAYDAAPYPSRLTIG